MTQHYKVCKKNCDLLKYRCPTEKDLYNKLCQNQGQSECAVSTLFRRFSFIASILVSIVFLALS